MRLVTEGFFLSGMVLPDIPAGKDRFIVGACRLTASWPYGCAAIREKTARVIWIGDGCRSTSAWPRRGAAADRISDGAADGYALGSAPGCDRHAAKRDHGFCGD